MKSTGVDWNVRDEELVSHVTSTADRIKNASRRARRVTVTAIGTELGSFTFTKASLAKLPLTALALKANVESYEQFALRRIWQTVDDFVIHRLRSTRKGLIRAAGVGGPVYKLASVQRAIIDAIDYLDRRIDTVPSGSRNL